MLFTPELCLMYNFKVSKNRRVRRFVSSALISILFIGYFQITPASAAVKNFTIGFQGPLSGPESQVGIAQLDAVNYAVAKFNQRFLGKLKVTVSQFDDQGDPAIAQKIAPGIAGDTNILGLIGPSYSGATIASLPFYKAQNLPMISPTASNVVMTEPGSNSYGYPVFHRVALTLKTEGASLYRTAIAGVSSPRVAIVFDGSSYGGSVAKSIMAVATIDTIALEPISVSANASGIYNWSTSVSTINASQANVVIYAGYYPQAATFFTQLRNSGYRGTLAGSEGVNYSGILDFTTTSVLEGVRLVAGTAPLSEISADMESDFRLIVGKPSGVYATESIDATNVMLYCIASGVVNRAQMLSCIDGFRGSSIYGNRYGFDSYGDNTSNAFYGFEVLSGSIRLNAKSKPSKRNTLEILSSFAWFNVTPLDEGVKVSLSQINSYTVRALNLIDTLNVLTESADSINANVQDAIDSKSFTLLAEFKAQMSTLETSQSAHLKNLDELSLLSRSMCLLANSLSLIHI